jgi:hypothetical protein
MRFRSGILGGFGGFRDCGFQTTSEFATRQKNAPPTAETLQTDVSAQPHHHPIRAPAGMRLSEPQHIRHLKVRQHLSSDQYESFA